MKLECIRFLRWHLKQKMQKNKCIICLWRLLKNTLKVLTKRKIRQPTPLMVYSGKFIYLHSMWNTSLIRVRKKPNVFWQPFSISGQNETYIFTAIKLYSRCIISTQLYNKDHCQNLLYIMSMKNFASGISPGLVQAGATYSFQEP